MNERSSSISDQKPSQINSDPSLAKAFECARAAIDKKSENNRILFLGDISSFTDYFVICSAHSERQVQSIADSVQFYMKSQGAEVLSMEGYSEGRWVLIDFGDVVVHVFLDALREYYNLENLWEDAERVPIPKEFFSAPSRSGH